jgi:hypothetical protein
MGRISCNTMPLVPRIGPLYNIYLMYGTETFDCGTQHVFFRETGHRLEICLMDILREAFRTVSDDSTLRNDGLLYCKTNTVYW